MSRGGPERRGQDGRIPDALELDERERATLALELMESLAPPERRGEAAWIEEIERRAHRAVSGESPGIDLDDAIDHIEHDLAL